MSIFGSPSASALVHKLTSHEQDLISSREVPLSELMSQGQKQPLLTGDRECGIVAS